jgi:prophage DNA circulation protein
MIKKPAMTEAVGIINRMAANLLNGLPTTGETGAAVRTAVGDVVANGEDLIKQGTIGSDLWDCFEKARQAGLLMANMESVRVSVEAETPVYDIGQAIKLSGIVFAFAEECQIIANFSFASRLDVQAVMMQVLPIIDDTKLAVAELLDGMSYQRVVSLAAALVQHLSSTEIELPEIVNYQFGTAMPSLYVANYIYSDGSRSDELIEENGTIHPAFMQRELIALSE